MPSPVFLVERSELSGKLTAPSAEGAREAAEGRSSEIRPGALVELSGRLTAHVRLRRDGGAR